MATHPAWCGLGRCLRGHAGLSSAGAGIATCHQRVPVRPGARVPLLRLALPLSKRPGLTVLGFHLSTVPAPNHNWIYLR
jgi:hypothetical protein